jgi:hypothetical protein
LHTEALRAELTADFQTARADSTWHRYRQLSLLRKQYPALWQQPFEVIERGEQHLVVRRGEFVVFANLSPDPLPAPVLDGATVLFESAPGAASSEHGVSHVAAETAVVARSTAR